MKNFAAILGITFLISFAAQAGPLACLRLMSPLYPYANPKAEFLNSGAPSKSRFLGEGASAAVFMIRDSSKKDSVLVKKIYHNDGHGSQRFEEDAATLDALRVTSKPSTFLVASAKRQMAYQADLEMTELSLIMEFVPGRSVHELLLDPKMPETVRSEVSKNFAGKLAELKRELSTQILVTAPIKQVPPAVKYFADGSLDKMMMLTTTLKGSHQLLIKSDNVIVDPLDLNKMTIIDPY